MNITEYAENLFNLAYSQEMIDFITNLGDTSSDESVSYTHLEHIEYISRFSIFIFRKV